MTNILFFHTLLQYFLQKQKHFHTIALQWKCLTSKSIAKVGHTVGLSVSSVDACDMTRGSLRSGVVKSLFHAGFRLLSANIGVEETLGTKRDTRRQAEAV